MTLIRPKWPTVRFQNIFLSNSEMPKKGRQRQYNSFGSAKFQIKIMLCLVEINYAFLHKWSY